MPLLLTKLYVPPPRPGIVARQRLVERLDEGLAAGRKLTLVSASAGFGKTTLISEWIAGCGRPAAWVSLDERDGDAVHFLSYLTAALQTIHLEIGVGLLALLQSPQPPQAEVVLISLLNEISGLVENFVLVLDDYHALDSQAVDHVLAFLVDHQPPQMHLVIATREDPSLPLARLRARGQCTELRTADLRFTPAETTEFLNRVMRLNLSEENIRALEARTEGWIAGLQMAAISMQGAIDVDRFIQSFTGSHRFVLDYLVEEVLRQHPENIQAFLLHTSILDRLCGPLCDAVLLHSPGNGEATLLSIERANLFINSLDNERCWYRYHHLFRDLLHKRLDQNSTPEGKAELHLRASQWFEENDLTFEAFRHATAANDIERAERLLKGKGIPLHSLATVNAILSWLDSLPTTVLNARPWLWVKSATSMLMAGRTSGVEEKLLAAEKAIQQVSSDNKTRDLIGQIAAIRATLAILQYLPEATISQALRALEYLQSDNLPYRSRAFWALGAAYQFQGERSAARQAYTEGIKLASGNTYYTGLIGTCLGQIQESENQYHQAAETYRRSLQLLSDQGPPNASEEYIGLARICYEWNDLDASEKYCQLSFQQARQYDSVIDRFITCQVLLARLKLARGEVADAAAILAEADQSVRQSNFVQRIPEVIDARVLVDLCQGNVAEAARLVEAHDLPISQARVFLAQDEPSKALDILAPLRQQLEEKGWQNERLKVMVLQAVALQAHGDKDRAVQVLGEALSLAKPGGFIRLFMDEGEAMRLLLLDFRSWMIKQSPSQNHELIEYTDKLMAAFSHPVATTPISKIKSRNMKLVEPLSERELEVLKLLRSELSGPEIAQHLVVSLNTLRTHTKNIFNKLGVNDRRAAIRRAEELDLF